LGSLGQEGSTSNTGKRGGDASASVVAGSFVSSEPEHPDASTGMRRQHMAYSQRFL
jgi:hypothetical protein